jgi:hypothetical protein
VAKPAAEPIDPFNSYLKAEAQMQPQRALLRFASRCGLDLSAASVRYADRPGDAWLKVKDLASGSHDRETDFFGTVAIRKLGNKLLVEMWEMESDVGSESRMFYCLDNGKVTLLEVTDWTLTVGETEGSASGDWGYEQPWAVNPAGRFVNSTRRFVDAEEKPIRTPKLDAQTLKHLRGAPTERVWVDLKLPSTLLR